MYKQLNLIIIIMAIACAIHTSGAFEERLLNRQVDMQASGIAEKIWAEVSFSKKTIEESLAFINHLSKVDAKYGQEEKFSQLVKDTQSNINDVQYKKFSDTCSSLFCDLVDMKKKVGIHLLLERVSEIYSKKLRELRILQERKRAYLAEQGANTLPGYYDDKLFDSLFNFNKSAHTH